MNYKSQISDLENHLIDLKSKQKIIESHCEHSWEEPKHEIEDKSHWKDCYDGDGNESKKEYVREFVDKWTRECSKCGKIETTYKQKPERYKPVFK